MVVEREEVVGVGVGGCIEKGIGGVGILEEVGVLGGGVVVVVVWVGCVQVMVDVGKKGEWFKDGMMVGVRVMGGVGLVGWVMWEVREGKVTDWWNRGGGELGG